MKISRPFAIALSTVSLIIFALLIYQYSKNNVSVGRHWDESNVSVPQASSSAHATELEDDPNLLPAEEISEHTYVASVCDGEIPSTWHVRSSEDQAIWNQRVPSELRADDFFTRFSDDRPLVFYPPFKPALYSMAAADTSLLGYSDDPGAEDSNRLELDILAISQTEMETLLDRLQDTPDEYAWKIVTVDGQELQVLRSVEAEGKYVGQELVFVPADVAGEQNGLIIFNRSNYWSDPNNVAFRNGVRHFLETMNFASCPREWFS